jgi:hypothetical protein
MWVLLKNIIGVFYILCFLKWYHHLHPMSRSKVGYVEQTIYENFNLDIFQQIVSTIEPTKDLIIKERFDF